MSAIPPGRRYRADEPAWYRKLCIRGHSLRVHGRPNGNSYACRACRRPQARERYARQREEFRPAREVDWVVVHRLTNGQHLPWVHGQDRHAAVEQLYAQGWGIIRTAHQIGTTPRTVARIRARIREGRAYGQAS